MKKQNKKPRKKKQVASHAHPKSEVINNHVKKFREEKGWDQTSLAEKALMNASFLSKIENGNRKQVSVPVAIRICKALGKTVEETFICG